MEKNSFILYTEYTEEVAMLSDEEAGQLMKAVFAHAAGQEPPELQGGARLLFPAFRRKLDKDREAWEIKCRVNAENGKKGGRPKKEREEASPEKPGGFSGKPKEPAGQELELDLEPDLDLDPEQEREEREGLSCDPQESRKNSSPENGDEQELSLPLRNGSFYSVTKGQRERWEQLFPEVDVPRELRAMAAWCEMNPARRKTGKNILRFVNGWLTNARDRAEEQGFHPSVFAETEREPLFDLPAEL